MSFKLAVFYGLWHKHVLEWWKHKDDSNVLFLKYEDLKKVIALTCCVTFVCNLDIVSTNNVLEKVKLQISDKGPHGQLSQN